MPLFAHSPQLINTPKTFYLHLITLKKYTNVIYSIYSKSMYIIDLNQYAIEFVAYLLVLIAYFFESIIYMQLEKSFFDLKKFLDFFPFELYYIKINYFLSFCQCCILIKKIFF